MEPRPGIMARSCPSAASHASLRACVRQRALVGGMVASVGRWALSRLTACSARAGGQEPCVRVT
eukprot:3035339-Lingulodinium_polyedra.AAC.1